MYFAKGGCPSEFSVYTQANNSDAATGSFNGVYSYTSIDAKSAGADGKYGTSDDGLPATFDEFFVLCDRMIERGVTPFTISDQFGKAYMNYLFKAIFADYEGAEQLALAYDFNGTAKHLIESISNDGVVTFKPETTITNNNGYEMFTSAGRYYALEFVERMLSKATYQNDHPYWYNTASGRQICYTARGNQDEYNALVNTVFELMKKQVMDNENVKHLGFSIEDDLNCWCTCDACNANLNKYGANVSSVIIFMNDLSKKFEEFFNENGIEREVDFLFFAYKDTEVAPVKKNSDGTYTATYQEMICRDNVYPFICTFNAKRAASLSSKHNTVSYENMKAWQALSDNCALWTYTENYDDYLAPRDCITSLQENYRVVAKMNPVFYKEESQGKNYNGTGFESLKYWLSYKLAWDVESNVEELIDEYFEHYFKDAAQPMKQYFNEFRVYLNKLLEEENYSQQDQTYINANLFSYGLLAGWNNHIEDAYNSIAYLQKTDAQLYEKLYKRICLESVTINYSIATIYGSNFSRVEYESMLDQLANDCAISKINYFSDNYSVTIEDKISQMRG